MNEDKTSLPSTIYHEIVLITRECGAAVIIAFHIAIMQQDGQILSLLITLLNINYLFILFSTF